MEFQLMTNEGAYPCEITLDLDNGRYMIRQADTSGEVFNSPEELYSWMKHHFDPSVLSHPSQYTTMMSQIEQLLMNENG